MSIALMTEVWVVDLTPSLKLVLLALADNANDDGICWPSIDTIAVKTGRSRREAFRALAKLEEIGQISREARKGHSNLFHIHPIPVTSSTPVTIRPPVTSSTPTGDIQPTGGVTLSTPTRDTEHTQNHQEPSVKPKRTIKARISDFQLPEDLDAELWADFEEMRRKIRKPLTDRARWLIVGRIANLEKQGHTPQRVLMQSVRNGWQDVFPVRSDAK